MGQIHGISRGDYGVTVEDRPDRSINLGLVADKSAPLGVGLNADEARFIARCLTEAASRVENGVKGET